MEVPAHPRNRAARHSEARPLWVVDHGLGALRGGVVDKVGRLRVHVRLGVAVPLAVNGAELERAVVVRGERSVYRGVSRVAHAGADDNVVHRERLRVPVVGHDVLHRALLEVVRASASADVHAAEVLAASRRRARHAECTAAEAHVGLEVLLGLGRQRVRNHQGREHLVEERAERLKHLSLVLQRHVLPGNERPAFPWLGADQCWSGVRRDRQLDLVKLSDARTQVSTKPPELADARRLGARTSHVSQRLGLRRLDQLDLGDGAAVDSDALLATGGRDAEVLRHVRLNTKLLCHSKLVKNLVCLSDLWNRKRQWFGRTSRERRGGRWRPTPRPAAK
mmetsp:Transcript_17587/g.37893  ORF Transcript_17587/g.37893 Transcript_17587/m.37893 type:complete len:336 (-) Transcript_17587:202-1209(-)